MKVDCDAVFGIVFFIIVICLIIFSIIGQFVPAELINKYLGEPEVEHVLKVTPNGKMITQTLLPMKDLEKDCTECHL